MTPGTVGILGGGQLGQMLILAGLPLGFRFVVWDPDPASPAGKLAEHHFCAPFDCRETLTAFAGVADRVTYEFENVPRQLVEELERRVDLPQGSHLLATCQHRLREKQALQRLGIGTAPFRAVSDEQAVLDCLQDWGTPLLLKTCEGGYDGKGQVRVSCPAEAESAWQALGAGARELISEGWVAFEREVSVLVARSTVGEIACFPIVENVHEAGILALSIVPARISEAQRQQAEAIAIRIATGLQLHGLLAVEMFALPSGDLLVNELAPRPHNSGHYTQDGTNVCQFEQHLRAIQGWPLVLPLLYSPTVMLNLLGEHVPALEHWWTQMPASARLHWYSKETARKGRKMAHLNLTSVTVEEALSQLEEWNLRPLPEGAQGR